MKNSIKRRLQRLFRQRNAKIVNKGLCRMEQIEQLSVTDMQFSEVQLSLITIAARATF